MENETQNKETVVSKIKKAFVAGVFTGVAFSAAIFWAFIIL